MTDCGRTGHYRPRVFIAGAGGMLGRAVSIECQRRDWPLFASDIDCNEPWLQYCDVRDIEQIRAACQTFRPSCILNLAALTDLEECESNQANADLTNTGGAENLARVAQELGAELVYVSTAGVFDGTKSLYLEDDTPNPANVYGRTKLEGERRSRRYCSKTYILRAGWMMGGGKKDKKFISLIWKQVLSGATLISVVNDKVGTPTYTHEFARLMFSLLESKADYGVYHLACKGACSRVEVAQELLRITKRHDVQVSPVHSDFFRDKYFAPRARSECLATSRNGSLTQARHWLQCLRQYIEQDDFREITV